MTNGIAAAPIVTVDAVIPRLGVKGTEILLIQRQEEPFKHMWALPSGKVDEQDPTLQEAVTREVREETGILLNPFGWLQLHTFGDKGRDPRGRWISVLYLAPMQCFVVTPQAGDDACDVRWFPVYALPPLAFDHAVLVAVAVRALHNNVVANEALITTLHQQVPLSL